MKEVDIYSMYYVKLSCQDCGLHFSAEQFDTLDDAMVYVNNWIGEPCENCACEKEK